jgi:hypothetical protein
MEPVEIGVTGQPLTLSEAQAVGEQITTAASAATFDEALASAIFTAASVMLLENYGQLQREMSEYNNS